ncbi:MAG: type II toxin-antitoxin system VapC family toxin [Gemmatimonadetes bacterium]|nr:type II toxin-antitoxin system VapC family toxin [Gemmatimonadota bacterium]MYB05420.1 type II toxin-antitoxin system VapC family toxin [Gemmatimonadota bacterium]MYE14852.1 type II toxin-antitoxin system VapC family toxin [Gemmatimonadota bacterium]MYG22498.1 type II toxin-antitoxin system VapC family toxin [Gemmatimonadota bacterium]MYJ39669.1 type II toxin-antitoxin system VapC family toxin [Gemmatimonadota bacterium]
MTTLLDTHVLIWWLQGDGPLSTAQRRVLEAADADSPLRISDISLWEIATLHSLQRIRLALPLREWLAKAVAPPLVRRHGISPAIASEVAALPGSFHRDPADRIIVATARVVGATLLTHDRHILNSGLVATLN